MLSMAYNVFIWNHYFRARQSCKAVVSNRKSAPLLLSTDNCRTAVEAIKKIFLNCRCNEAADGIHLLIMTLRKSTNCHDICKKSAVIKQKIFYNSLDIISKFIT